MKKKFVLLPMLLLSFFAFADEGMWIAKELNKQSVHRMKDLGFTFPMDSLYSEDNPSLKDAVVIFGGGCTGVTVSNQGLIFTNHHCGYRDIQKLSSVDHDYLKNGFVSQSFVEELPAEGLQISYLSKTEDVTDFVTSTLVKGDSEEVRKTKIDSLITKTLEPYRGNQFVRAQVVPFYGNNKYYLVVYDVFKDVRLVFTPPSSVGKYGGDTDNWMWPRHTGDFSVFRVYANKNNEPALYSKDNVPYTPKYFVPVSLKGYDENDYSMTIGFPGRTMRYIPSWGIQQKVESEHKPRIEVRGAKQAIWKEAMNADDAVRIKYASKYAGSSNYWKNAMGMNEAIARLQVIEGKQRQEDEFQKWADKKKNRKASYGNVLPMLKDAYTASDELAKISTYFSETFLQGIEIAGIAGSYKLALGKDSIFTNSIVEGLEQRVYKDYEPSLDEKVTGKLLSIYKSAVPSEYLPSFYEKIATEFNGDCDAYAKWMFDHSIITSKDGIKAILANDSALILNDPAVEFASALSPIRTKIMTEFGSNATVIAQGNRDYIAGMMEMNPDKAFSADANFTQRLSYGSIKGYSPADAVIYKYYTTVPGVLAKVDPLNPEFNLQQYIINDLKSGDFGQYRDKDGSMHVNFLSNNDITGGNSGSPVFNGQAQLIGLAFDGNWEALSGDIVFNPDMQRCINVDIRYVLYMIDKVGKCPRLIDELKLIK